MKKILVIGGDSFIAQQLYIGYKENFEFVALSRINSAFENEVILADFGQIELSAYNGCDAVINFAAIVHKPSAPEKIYEEVNHKLAVDLAKKAQKANVPHFIQMSTIAVYGNAPHISVDTLANPENNYGVSKLNADKEIQKLSNDKFKVSIVRPPMVYGGNKMAPGNMQRLIKLSQKGLPLPFKNMPNQRHFLHVKNLVNCLCCIIQNATKSDIYLPTDQNSYSTEDILRSISSLTNKKLQLFSVPQFLINKLKVTKPEIFERVYGNKTIYHQPELYKIGYKPEFSLADGLKEML